jgi:hypothetical protein
MKNKKTQPLKIPGKMIFEPGRKVAKIGLASLLLLSLNTNEAAAQNGFSQNPVWALNGNKLSFTNGVGVVPTITSSAAPVSGIHNSYSSKDGTLLFYIDGNIVSNGGVYKADGTLIGNLESSSNPFYPTIALVPKPGSCDEVYIVYFSDNIGGEFKFKV